MCNGTLYEGANGEGATRCVPQGRKRVAARKAAMGLVFLAACVFLSPRFSYIQILRDEWLSKGWLERYVCFVVNRRSHGSQGGDRLLEIQLIGVVERTKYYAVWSLAEASSKTHQERDLHWILGRMYRHWLGVQWVRRSRPKHMGCCVEHQYNVDRNAS